MESNKAFEEILRELTGKDRDIKSYAENLAEHLNKLKRINDKVLDEDYDQAEADLELEIVKIYTAWIATNALEENGFEEVNGEWVKKKK